MSTIPRRMTLRHVALSWLVKMLQRDDNVVTRQHLLSCNQRVRSLIRITSFSSQLPYVLCCCWCCNLRNLSLWWWWCCVPYNIETHIEPEFYELPRRKCLSVPKLNKSQSWRGLERFYSWNQWICPQGNFTYQTSHKYQLVYGLQSGIKLNPMLSQTKALLD